MVLTKNELIASLQNEARILLHLASKIEPNMVDYRPTPKQRSTIELLRYLALVGPMSIKNTMSGGAFDREAWEAANAELANADLDRVVSVLATHPAKYAELLEPCSDQDFRVEVDGMDGKTSRGAAIVNFALCGYAAYRTQLFLYLKACGREELNTMNLWAGTDAAMAT